MLTDEKRGPGRPRKEQRRRRGGANVIGKRLPVNPEKLDFDNFSYRWINDDPARIFHMTQNDDWDILTNDGQGIVDSNDDLGSAYSKVVGTTADGVGRRAYLCRKPRKWYDADQKQKQKELDEQLAQLRRGNDASGKAQGDYVPHSGINL